MRFCVSRPANRSPLHRTGPRTAMSVALAVLAVAGCDGRFYGTAPDSGTDADPLIAARLLYDRDVLPILSANCTACHASVGAVGGGFMAPNPDSYATMITWPNLVFPGDATSSRIFSYARGEQHSGTQLTPDQGELVRRWVEAEPPRAPVAPPTETTRFRPQFGVTNTIELASLGDGLDGTTMTFDADLLAGGGLYLKFVKLHAGTNGTHVVHPLFQTYCPTTPVPDPVDSLSAIDLIVNAGDVATLGAGTVVLANISDDCELSVHFKTIEPGEFIASPDGGLVIGGGCTNVASFTANAQNPFSNRCAGCHAGGNMTAKNAFDLSAINDLSADGQAAACAQAVSTINRTNEVNSRLFQRVEPGQATGHPLTLNDAEFTAFRDAIVSWATSESD